jgi:hypothetical protein
MGVLGMSRLFEFWLFSLLCWGHGVAVPLCYGFGFRLWILPQFWFDLALALVWFDLGLIGVQFPFELCVDLP